ncbi:MAG: DUF3800 domain-containing protein [Chloroflexota bacterium]
MISQKITLTFAGDESGDVSFNFGKGASRYLVMAVIGTSQPQALRQALADARRNLSLPAHYEFGFNSMASSGKLRQGVFSALRQADFEAWAIVVDKTTLPEMFRAMRRLDFYLYFVTELLQAIPAEKREGATLILDEFGGEPELSRALRGYMNRRGMPRRFTRVLTKRSKSEPLIQAADLVAGAVFRRDSQGDAEAYEFIEGKLRAIVEYRVK